MNILNKVENKAAMTIEGKGDTTIELDGNNRLENSEKNADGTKWNYNYHAALEKSGDETGTLTITDTDDIGGKFNNRGSLTATGQRGTGIGGGRKRAEIISPLGATPMCPHREMMWASAAART